jgi:glycerol-3-phosphate dehydrogenase
MEHFDTIIIGGGVLGCFAARNMCRWKLSVLLLEAAEDICTGITRANSAIVYAGYDMKPGTRKAEMTVRANADFDRLCAELDAQYPQYGIAKHKGYGTKAHMDALREHGPCEIYRTKFIRFLDK